MLTVGNEAITDWVRLITQGLMEDTELRQGWAFAHYYPKLHLA